MKAEEIPEIIRTVRAALAERDAPAASSLTETPKTRGKNAKAKALGDAAPVKRSRKKAEAAAE